MLYMRAHPHLLAALAPVAAWDHGDIKLTSSYSAPEAPPVPHPIYNPYAGYGEANANWQPPAFNRAGRSRSRPRSPTDQPTSSPLGQQGPAAAPTRPSALSDAPRCVLTEAGRADSW